jgi:hypothetical protein
MIKQIAFLDFGFVFGAFGFWFGSADIFLS